MLAALVVVIVISLVLGGFAVRGAGEFVTKYTLPSVLALVVLHGAAAAAGFLGLWSVTRSAAAAFPAGLTAAITVAVIVWRKT